jgi:hypothetical protein
LHVDPKSPDPTKRVDYVALDRRNFGIIFMNGDRGTMTDNSETYDVFHLDEDRQYTIDEAIQLYGNATHFNLPYTRPGVYTIYYAHVYVIEVFVASIKYKVDEAATIYRGIFPLPLALERVTTDATLPPGAEFRLLYNAPILKRAHRCLLKDSTYDKTVIPAELVDDNGDGVLEMVCNSTDESRVSTRGTITPLLQGSCFSKDRCESTSQGLFGTTYVLFRKEQQSGPMFLYQAYSRKIQAYSVPKLCGGRVVDKGDYISHQLATLPKGRTWKLTTAQMAARIADYAKQATAQLDAGDCAKTRQRRNAVVAGLLEKPDAVKSKLYSELYRTAVKACFGSCSFLSGATKARACRDVAIHSSKTLLYVKPHAFEKTAYAPPPPVPAAEYSGPNATALRDEAFGVWDDSPWVPPGGQAKRQLYLRFHVANSINAPGLDQLCMSKRYLPSNGKTRLPLRTKKPASVTDSHHVFPGTKASKDYCVFETPFWKTVGESAVLSIKEGKSTILVYNTRLNRLPLSAIMMQTFAAQVQSKIVYMWAFSHREFQSLVTTEDSVLAALMVHNPHLEHVNVMIMPDGMSVGLAGAVLPTTDNRWSCDQYLDAIENFLQQQRLLACSEPKRLPFYRVRNELPT